MIHEVSFSRDELEVLLLRIAEMRDVLIDLERDGYEHSPELRFVSILAAKKIKDAMDNGLKYSVVNLHVLECHLLITFAEIGKDFAEVGDIEVEKEKYGALYASIKRKLQSACKRHKAELNRYDNMATDKRVFYLKENCPVTDEDYEEGLSLLNNLQDGLEYAAENVRQCLKKNIALLELISGISPYDLKIDVKEEQNVGLAVDSMLEENPDGQLTHLSGVISLNTSQDESQEKWIKIGELDGIFVHIVDTEEGLLEGADTHDQELYDAITTIVEHHDDFPRRVKTGIFHLQQIIIEENYRGLGIGKVVLPIVMVRSVRGASIATACSEDEIQEQFLQSIGFERVEDTVWAIRL